MKANRNLARPMAAIGLLALLAAGPAYAADVISEEPPAPAAPMEEPPVASWAGPYAGVSLGYGFSGTTTPDTGDIDTDGFLGGVFAGYNLQNGLFVYGIEGDVGYSGVKGDNGITETKSGFEGSLRGRLGVAVTNDILLYGTAGGAAERLKVSDPAGDDSNALLGWTAGAGVDVKLTEQVFGRVEYRYTDFGSADFNTGSGPQSVDSKENRVTFGIGMKF
jgi:outer membrane immunogenic protein